MANVRIVLVEPAGPRNVGAIARVMKNMGVRQLIIVNPQCDPVGAEARQMAVHAADILEAARCVETVPEALQGCQRAIATTARERSLDTPLEHPAIALPWLIESSSPSEADPSETDKLPESALIFGPEERGLSNTELNYAQRFVRIPSSDTYPSLNLAQAVAICCYELREAAIGERSPVRQAKFDRLAPGKSGHSDLVAIASSDETEASLDALEGYYQQLEAVLLKIGYLYPHTASSRMEKFRRLFNRATLSDTEVAMLRGILSQFEWALQEKPED